ncbi:MAG: ASCH domain-containing protein [Methylovulum sp.]|nr:ASCH domain-containing protein [Methylovulum sp.]
MLALSIQNPWAWAILYCGKDIENRSWSTRVRGSVLIHVGKKFDVGGIRDIGYICGKTPPRDLPTGGIVGVVDIVGCVNKSDSQWFFGEWGFVLSNARPLPFFPCRGSLGFFDVNYPGVQEILKNHDANAQQPQQSSAAALAV